MFPLLTCYLKRRLILLWSKVKMSEYKNQESKRGRNSVGVNEEVCRFMRNHFQRLYLSASP